MVEELKICTSCVMDTTDPNIQFDSEGVCDQCLNYKTNVIPFVENAISNDLFKPIADKIKLEGKSKDFDCILGMSGGLDSSYLLHKVVTVYGLRPLVFHVDAGWNTREAVNNIENLIKGLGLDLYTEVINWNEIRDLQLAFFKSGVAHLDVPQDHAFISVLYHYAAKYGIKYILNGGNFSTEGIRNPLSWLYYGSDAAQIKDISKKFGTVRLQDYPLTNILWHKFYLPYFKGTKVIKPLNFLEYNKANAEKELADCYGWQGYPQKHFESRFTRFFEGFWLPHRFGFDTRKPQFSSLIVSGQMTREKALSRLEVPSLSKEQVEKEFYYIADKLEITEEELWLYFNMEKTTYKEYKNHEWIFNFGSSMLTRFGVEKAVKR